MNLRTKRHALNQNDCKALDHAWHLAAIEGYPLNAFITVRPAGNLTPLEHAEIVDQFWNRLAVWSRRHTDHDTFHCILTREAVPNGNQFGVGEHFHTLVHVSASRLNALKVAVARWHPAPGEAVVKPASQNIAFTANGKISSAIGYLTKQRSPQAWYRSNFRRKPGGIVLGKRYRISANLRAKPIDRALSDTKVAPWFAANGRRV